MVILNMIGGTSGGATHYPIPSGTYSGSITNGTWSIADGVLTLTGTGTMPNYSTSSIAPWSAHQSYYRKVVITGFTTIGSYAFFCNAAIEEVDIKDSVITINNYAFYNCTALQSITIPSSVTYIDDYIFYNCTALQSITIPSSVTHISSHAFYTCTGVRYLDVSSSVFAFSAFDLTGIYARGLTTIIWRVNADLTGQINGFNSSIPLVCHLYCPAGYSFTGAVSNATVTRMGTPDEAPTPTVG